MADPQVEDGFVRISNELLEALCKIKIPSEARRVLDVIFRKTYGFNKKEDEISLSQFNKATNILIPNVVRAIKTLKSMNLINKTKKYYITTYSIQKDCDKWYDLSTIEHDTISPDSCQEAPQSTIEHDSESTIEHDRYNRHLLKTNKRQEILKKSQKPKTPWDDDYVGF